MGKQRRRKVVRPVRLSSWHDEHLRRWARHHGGNKSEVVREMIEARVRLEQEGTEERVRQEQEVESEGVDLISGWEPSSGSDVGRAA